MNIQLKNWLQSLYQSVLQEFSKRPIATISALAGIIVLSLPLILSESLRGFVGYRLSAILQPTIKLSIFPLIIVFLILVVAFVASFKNQKQEKKNHYFIPFGDFTWKVDLSEGYPQTEFLPYCKTHQIKIIDSDGIGLFCPICGVDSAKQLPYKTHKAYKEAVQNIADAKENNHIKIESNI